MPGSLSCCTGKKPEERCQEMVYPDAQVPSLVP